MPNTNKLTEFVAFKRSQRYTLKAILKMLDITDRQYRWAIKQTDAQLKMGLISRITELTK
jgi:hypothetical protein